MVTKTATRPSPRSSHSHSHSQTFRSSKNPTTPSSPLPRSAISVGQPFPPSRDPLWRSSTTQEGHATSPSYFGLSVDGAGDAREPAPSQNWSATSSSMLSFSAASPRPKPIDPSTEADALEKQTASNNDPSGGFSYFTAGAGPVRPRLDVRTESQGPSPSPKSMPKPRKDSPEAIEIDAGRDSAYPSTTEKAALSLSRDGRAASDGSLSSIVSPMQRHALSPVNDKHRLHSHSLSSTKRDVMSLMIKGQHRHESPTAREDGPAMVAPAQLKDMIENLPCEEFILLDLRVFPQFAESRIKGALNLCIPTTLLKRPSFNVQKLQDTFTNDIERARFSQWANSKYIVVYDAHSGDRKEATTAVNTLKKFSNEGWKGTSYILNGGFAEFRKSYPDLIDNRSAQGMQSSKINLTMGTPTHRGAAVAGGCIMPKTQNAANPFFGNIRQNQDLRGGVGLVDMKVPEELAGDRFEILPKWLQRILAREDEGKKASQMFLRIEEEEQARMKKALSLSTCYGPGAEEGDYQIAGLEKGGKNRYNNIWPFEHARVRLKGRPEGSCDYINASHIKASRSKKRYIAAQGPLPDTFADFWSAIFQEDVRVIVMLTAEEEGGQQKCHSYWQSKDYGPLKVKVLSEREVSLVPAKLRQQGERRDLGRRRATTSAENTPITPATDQQVATVRTFSLYHSDHPFTPIREVTQIQYTAWPDFGAPANPAQILALIDLCNQIQRAARSPTEPPKPMSPEEDDNIRPVLVHCSAGCGRTGTFCTVDSVVDMIKRQHRERRSGTMPMDTSAPGQENLSGPWLFDDDLDLIEATVEDFRRQRLSMVQSLKQFALCYETVAEWVAQLYVSGRASSRGRSGSDVGCPQGNM